MLLLIATSSFASVSGINFYRDGKYADAYEAFAAGGKLGKIVLTA